MGASVSGGCRQGLLCGGAGWGPASGCSGGLGTGGTGAACGQRVATEAVHTSPLGSAGPDRRRAPSPRLRTSVLPAPGRTRSQLFRLSPSQPASAMPHGSRKTQVPSFRAVCSLQEAGFVLVAPYAFVLLATREPPACGVRRGDVPVTMQPRTPHTPDSAPTRARQRGGGGRKTLVLLIKVYGNAVTPLAFLLSRAASPPKAGSLK